MNDLLLLQAFLSNAHLTDPRLALANAVAWLDPMGLLSGPTGDDDEDEGDLEVALRICRTCFPDVFAGASQLLLQGATEQQLDHYICAGVNAHLTMELQDIEVMHYGIPLEFLGVDWMDADFFDYHADLADILADFGVQQDGLNRPLEQTLDIARRICDSLHSQPGQTYARVRSLLTWLFAGSGNSLIDMTDTEFWESGMEYGDWTPDNVAFMNEMADEALDLMHAAQAGLEALQEDPDLRAAFRHNIGLLTHKISKTGGKRNHAKRRLRWPERA